MPSTNLFFSAGSLEDAGFFPLNAQPWVLLDRWFSKVREWTLTYKGYSATLHREYPIGPEDRVTSEIDIPCHLSTPFFGSTPGDDPDVGGLNATMGLITPYGGSSLITDLKPFLPATGLTFSESVSGAGSLKPMLWIDGNFELTTFGPLTFRTWAPYSAGNVTMNYTLDGLAFAAHAYNGGAALPPPDDAMTIAPSRFWTHGGLYDELTGLPT